MHRLRGDYITLPRARVNCEPAIYVIDFDFFFSTSHFTDKELFDLMVDNSSLRRKNPRNGFHSSKDLIDAYLRHNVTLPKWTILLAVNTN